MAVLLLPYPFHKSLVHRVLLVLRQWAVGEDRLPPDERFDLDIAITSDGSRNESSVEVSRNWFSQVQAPSFLR